MADWESKNIHDGFQDISDQAIVKGYYLFQ